MAGATITTTGTIIRVCSSSSSPPPLNCRLPLIHNNRVFLSSSRRSTFLSIINTSSSSSSPLSTSEHHHQNHRPACHPPSSSHNNNNNNNNNTFISLTTKLYVSGLSFRTSEESLWNAFQSFGQLIEVNLVMDKVANRSRGFAFLRYATKEESDKAIEGMHGKFLDGRVIFVEFAKPRSQLNQGIKQDSKPYR